MNEDLAVSDFAVGSGSNLGLEIGVFESGGANELD